MSDTTFFVNYYDENQDHEREFKDLESAKAFFYQKLGDANDMQWPEPELVGHTAHYSFTWVDEKRLWDMECSA